MKVMFVDDEPKILEGIERMLFFLSDEWDMRFVTSGAEALAEIEKDPVDVIVSDMRMPGMDGATLLGKIQAQYPGIVRIVLSGHAELEAVLRAVPVAHQFLSKPCKADLLKSVVDRACSLRTLLEDEAVRRTVGTIESLPSVPRVFAALTRALGDETTDAKVIAKIVGQDVAMSAKVLQLVNSAFFSQATTISSIEQAVVRLGFQMVKNLALTIEVFRESGSDQVISGFSIEAAQQHALHTAAIAKSLLTDRALSEDAFMAAILHDVGKLVLAKELPEKFSEAQSMAQCEGIPMHVAERRLIGISHAEIGAYLMGIWGLPYPIVEAIANHHEPMRVPGRDAFGILEAVYVADCLANDADMDMNYLGTLGVQDQVETWREKANELAAA